MLLTMDLYYSHNSRHQWCYTLRLKLRQFDLLCIYCKLVCIICRQQIHQVELEPHSTSYSCQYVQQYACYINQHLLPGDYTQHAVLYDRFCVMHHLQPISVRRYTCKNSTWQMAIILKIEKCDISTNIWPISLHFGMLMHIDCPDPMGQ